MPIRAFLLFLAVVATVGADTLSPLLSAPFSCANRCWPNKSPDTGTTDWCLCCFYNCGGFRHDCFQNAFCQTPTKCSRLDVCDVFGGIPPLGALPGVAASFFEADNTTLKKSSGSPLVGGLRRGGDQTDDEHDGNNGVASCPKGYEPLAIDFADAALGGVDDRVKEVFGDIVDKVSLWSKCFNPAGAIESLKRLQVYSSSDNSSPYKDWLSPNTACPSGGSGVGAGGAPGTQFANCEPLDKVLVVLGQNGTRCGANDAEITIDFEEQLYVRFVTLLNTVTGQAELQGFRGGAEKYEQTFAAPTTAGDKKNGLSKLNIHGNELINRLELRFAEPLALVNLGLCAKEKSEQVDCGTDYKCPGSDCGCVRDKCKKLDWSQGGRGRGHCSNHNDFSCKSDNDAVCVCKNDPKKKCSQVQPTQPPFRCETARDCGERFGGCAWKCKNSTCQAGTDNDLLCQDDKPDDCWTKKCKANKCEKKKVANGELCTDNTPKNCFKSQCVDGLCIDNKPKPENATCCVHSCQHGHCNGSGLCLCPTPVPPTTPVPTTPVPTTPVPPSTPVPTTPVPPPVVGCCRSGEPPTCFSNIETGACQQVNGTFLGGECCGNDACDTVFPACPEAPGCCMFTGGGQTACATLDEDPCLEVPGNTWEAGDCCENTVCDTVFPDCPTPVPPSTPVPSTPVPSTPVPTTPFVGCCVIGSSVCRAFPTPSACEDAGGVPTRASETAYYSFEQCTTDELCIFGCGFKINGSCTQGVFLFQVVQEASVFEAFEPNANCCDFDVCTDVAPEPCPETGCCQRQIDGVTVCINDSLQNDCNEDGDSFMAGESCCPNGACEQIEPVDNCPKIGCCLPDSEECQVVTSARCELLGGTNSGTAEDCAEPGLCQPPVQPGCCLPGVDACQELTEADCRRNGGQPAGTLTECVEQQSCAAGCCVTQNPVNCTQNTIKLNCDGELAFTTDCCALGVCQNVTGPEPCDRGSCCVPDNDACMDLTDLQCSEQNGTRVRFPPGQCKEESCAIGCCIRASGCIENMRRGFCGSDTLVPDTECCKVAECSAFVEPCPDCVAETRCGERPGCHGGIHDGLQCQTLEQCVGGYKCVPLAKSCMRDEPCADCDKSGPRAHQCAPCRFCTKKQRKEKKWHQDEDEDMALPCCPFAEETRYFVKLTNEGTDNKATARVTVRDDEVCVHVLTLSGPALPLFLYIADRVDPSDTSDWLAIDLPTVPFDYCGDHPATAALILSGDSWMEINDNVAMQINGLLVPLTDINVDQERANKCGDDELIVGGSCRPRLDCACINCVDQCDVDVKPDCETEPWMPPDRVGIASCEVDAVEHALGFPIAGQKCNDTNEISVDSDLCSVFAKKSCPLAEHEWRLGTLEPHPVDNLTQLCSQPAYDSLLYDVYRVYATDRLIKVTLHRRNSVLNATEWEATDPVVPLVYVIDANDKCEHPAPYQAESVQQHYADKWGGSVSEKTFVIRVPAIGHYLVVVTSLESAVLPNNQTVSDDERRALRCTEYKISVDYKPVLCPKRELCDKFPPCHGARDCPGDKCDENACATAYGRCILADPLHPRQGFCPGEQCEQKGDNKPVCKGQPKGTPCIYTKRDKNPFNAIAKLCFVGECNKQGECVEDNGWSPTPKGSQPTPKHKEPEGFDCDCHCPRVCESYLDCNDHNSTTIDLCDEVTGVCVNRPRPPPAPTPTPTPPPTPLDLNLVCDLSTDVLPSDQPIIEACSATTAVNGTCVSSDPENATAPFVCVFGFLSTPPGSEGTQAAQGFCTDSSVCATAVLGDPCTCTAPPVPLCVRNLTIDNEQLVIGVECRELGCPQLAGVDASEQPLLDECAAPQPAAGSCNATTNGCQFSVLQRPDINATVISVGCATGVPATCLADGDQCFCDALRGPLCRRTVAGEPVTLVCAFPPVNDTEPARLTGASANRVHSAGVAALDAEPQAQPAVVRAALDRAELAYTASVFDVYGGIVDNAWASPLCSVDVEQRQIAVEARQTNAECAAVDLARECLDGAANQQALGHHWFDRAWRSLDRASRAAQRRSDSQQALVAACCASLYYEALAQWCGRRGEDYWQLDSARVVRTSVGPDCVAFDDGHRDRDLNDWVAEQRVVEVWAGDQLRAINVHVVPLARGGGYQSSYAISARGTDVSSLRAGPSAACSERARAVLSSTFDKQALATELSSRAPLAAGTRVAVFHHVLRAADVSAHALPLGVQESFCVSLGADDSDDGASYCPTSAVGDVALFDNTRLTLPPVAEGAVGDYYDTLSPSAPNLDNSVNTRARTRFYAPLFSASAVIVPPPGASGAANSLRFVLRNEDCGGAVVLATSASSSSPPLAISVPADACAAWRWSAEGVALVQDARSNERVCRGGASGGIAECSQGSEEQLAVCSSAGGECSETPRVAGVPYEYAARFFECQSCNTELACSSDKRCANNACCDERTLHWYRYATGAGSDLLYQPKRGGGGEKK